MILLPAFYPIVHLYNPVVQVGKTTALHKKDFNNGRPAEDLADNIMFVVNKSKALLNKAWLAGGLPVIRACPCQKRSQGFRP